MTAAQRLASMRNVRHLVWTGAERDPRRRAGARARDRPRSSIAAADLRLHRQPGRDQLRPVAQGRDHDAHRAAGHREPDQRLHAGLQPTSGGIFLLLGNSPCSPLNQADYADVAPARSRCCSPIATVSRRRHRWSCRPTSCTIIPIHHPGRRISISDAKRCRQRQPPVTVTLGADKHAPDRRRRPWDGRISTPAIRSGPGSTVSHWDPLARPDLIQEPESGYQHPHDVTMETALMHDIGWPSLCGNVDDGHRRGVRQRHRQQRHDARRLPHRLLARPLRRRRQGHR